MKLENVVPWGRNFEEYQNMFQLSKEDLQLEMISILEGKYAMDGVRDSVIVADTLCSHLYCSPLLHDG